MKPPPQLMLPPGMVLRLRKPLYGLRQSEKCWNGEIDEFLTKIGFTRCKFDPCIYVLFDKNGIIIIGLYVDDVLLAAKTQDQTDRILSKLHDRFQIKVMPVSMFLGIGITTTDKVFTLSQRTAFEDGLKQFNLEYCKSVSMPMDPTMNYDDPESPIITEATQVREAIAFLWFANATRPDIAFAVGMAARHREQPRACHWALIKRILDTLEEHWTWQS